MLNDHLRITLPDGAECVLPLGGRGEDVTFSEDAEGEIIYLHITIYAADAGSLANLIRQAQKISLEKTEASQ